VLWFSLVIGQNASRQLAKSSESLVTSAQFLVALATSESQFQALNTQFSVTLATNWLQFRTPLEVREHISICCAGTEVVLSATLIKKRKTYLVHSKI